MFKQISLTTVRHGFKDNKASKWIKLKRKCEICALTKPHISLFLTSSSESWQMSDPSRSLSARRQLCRLCQTSPSSSILKSKKKVSVLWQHGVCECTESVEDVSSRGREMTAVSPLLQLVRLASASLPTPASISVSLPAMLNLKLHLRQHLPTSEAAHTHTRTHAVTDQCYRFSWEPKEWPDYKLSACVCIPLHLTLNTQGLVFYQHNLHRLTLTSRCVALPGRVLKRSSDTDLYILYNLNLWRQHPRRAVCLCSRHRQRHLGV